MPQVMKGPFYIDSYDIGAEDFGDTPYADVVIGHPDGYRIVIHIKPWSIHTQRTEESIHVELM